MAARLTQTDVKTMKAAHITQWCAEGTVADTILLGEVPLPTALPIKQEVLIEVKASSINIDDVAVCQNAAGGGWFFHARTPSIEKPLVGGMEYAGVVLAVGPGCTLLKVGDRVCGVQDIAMKQMPGTWAEQTLAPEGDVVLIPPACEISFVQAAAVGMGAMVSGDMYKRAMIPSEGEEFRCLVLGASGGLGTIMLPLLRNHQGVQIHITAVCSSANADKVRRLGADEVVDYTTAPFIKQLSGSQFDVIFDFVGGVESERATTLLKRGGKFITACGPAQGIGDRIMTCCEWHSWCCGLVGRLLKSNCCCCCTAFKYEMAGDMPPLKAESFNTVAVEAGIRAEIALEVPFAEAPLREALRRVASRHTGGKVVINMELPLD